jgi:tripartite-type tricarboxylate transporter receptor subunit TctC
MAEVLPGFEINSWGGVMGPAGMSPAIVSRLNALTRQALESDDLKRRFLENGATPWWTSPEDLATYRAANEAALAPIIRASGARVD